MLKILLVVQPERFDFYGYLSGLSNCEISLLWYTDASQMKLTAADLPIPVKNIYYWNQFNSPRQLIQEIKPDRIIFFEIIDLRQISLIVTAKKLKVATFYLEHGAAGDRDTAISRWNETSFAKNKIPYFFNRLRKSSRDIVRSKLFYYSATPSVSGSSKLSYSFLPFKMLGHAPNKVLAHSLFPERVPHRSIVFNEANYQEYFLYTAAPRDTALLTGIPFFDKYFSTWIEQKDHVVYIDHPYLESGLLGWTDEHHRMIAEAISKFASRNNTKVYIKLHPRSDLARWKQYQWDEKLVEIIQFGDYTDLFLSAKLILGYSSSLITAFLCAKKNVVLLGWHPDAMTFGADFSALGLCHLSNTPADLDAQYSRWVNHNLAQENSTNYNEFLKKFNYPFDGKATERVLRAITEYEVS